MIHKALELYVSSVDFTDEPNLGEHPPVLLSNTYTIVEGDRVVLAVGTGVTFTVHVLVTLLYVPRLPLHSPSVMLVYTLGVGVRIGVGVLEIVGSGFALRQYVNAVPVRFLQGSGFGVTVGLKVIVGFGVIVTFTTGLGVAVGYCPPCANRRNSPVRSLCTRAMIKNVLAANNMSKTRGKICTNP